MRSSQLIEHNMGNISLETHIQNVVEKLFLGPFLNKTKLSISLGQYSKVLYVVLIACQVEVNWKWLKPCCRPFAFTSYIAFLKNKKMSGTRSPASFSA